MTMLMQNLGATNKEHCGMLWYFHEWSIILDFPVLLGAESVPNPPTHILMVAPEHKGLVIHTKVKLQSDSLR